MILNMLSTGAMTRLGYVYGNLMANVHAKNQKLYQRGLTILQQATKINRQAAERAMKASHNNVPVALIMLQADVTRAQAAQALKLTQGHIRHAITAARSL
jgi:N-acetylmuramic acid 6-phosphate etherase